MRKLLITTLLTLLISSSLFSITEINSLEEIEEFAIEGSIDYKNSLLDLEEAKENVEGIIKIDSTSISVGTSNNDLESENWTLKSGIDIPIIEQLSINGEIDQEMAGSVGVTLKPLAHSDTVSSSNIDYNRAVIDAQATLLSAQYSAVSASLDWMKNLQDMELQVKTESLNKLLYSDDKNRYDLGDITLDELQESLITWSESRKELLELQQNFKQAETTLYSSLGASSANVKVNVLTISDLEKSLNSLKESINIAEGDYTNSTTYRLSNFSAESAKGVFDNTWAYEPNISASADMSFSNDNSEPSTFSASLNFSIALDDFQVSKRDRVKESYQLAITQMGLEQNEAELKFNQSLEELESSLINSEIYSIEYEQAAILFQEAELLYKTGDYSEIEMNQSELYLESAKNSLFNSLATEYKVWMEFREYL